MFHDSPATDYDATLPTSAPDRSGAERHAHEALVVVCFVCRAFRDEVGGWVAAHSTAQVGGGRALTHGLCPGCLERLYPEAAEADAAGRAG